MAARRVPCESRLAGLPDTVVDRAKVILENLETTSHDATGKPVIARREDGTTRSPADGGQLSLFAVSPLPPAHRDALAALEKLDPNGLTPIDALNLLHELTRSIQ